MSKKASLKRAVVGSQNLLNMFKKAHIDRLNNQISHEPETVSTVNVTESPLSPSETLAAAPSPPSENMPEFLIETCCQKRHQAK